MVNVWLYSTASVLAVSLISLIGILTISVKEESLRKFLFVLVSFAAGGLLGDTFFHLLPELSEAQGYTAVTAMFILLGIVVSFIVEKVIHWVHCHHPAEHCAHSEKRHAPAHQAQFHHTHPFALMNLFGDAIHNLLDGIIIGASYFISIPVGLSTTAAIIFHEIPQEISDFGVLLHGGLSKARALWLNFLTAATAFLGLGFSFLLHSASDKVTHPLLAFAAGSFIYIASTDLIPELHKEVKVRRSVLQLVFFLAGIILLYGLALLE